MRIDILTLFLEMFEGPLNESMLKRAQDKKLLEINVFNIRDFARGKHSQVDDAPYGGGPGMVLKPEPIFEAVESIVDISHIAYRISPKAISDKAQRAIGDERIILMSPQGETFSQAKAEELSRESHLIFICGHYEGVDERVRKGLITDEISIGDYVLTGGELAAMVVIDCLARMIPGVLGAEGAALSDSFAQGILKYPHYTRPQEYEGMKVPPVLLSGNHQRVSQWRRKEALRRTWRRRPDLLTGIDLSAEDKELLEEIEREGRR